MSTHGTTDARWIRPALVAAVFAVQLVLAPFALADSPHVVPTTDTSSCAACHSAHVSTSGVLLRTIAERPTTTQICSGCHSGAESDASNVVTGTADSFALPSGHLLTPDSNSATGARISGCETCHDPHGASSRQRGIPAHMVNGHVVSSAGNELCEACHDSDNSWYGSGYPSTSAPTRDATGFPVSGTWPGPDTYSSTTNAHRLIPETTRTVDASDPVARQQGSCLYCHAAHGGKNTYDALVDTFTVPASSTLASDQAQGSFAALCFECHGGTTPADFDSAPTDIKRYVASDGASAGHRIVTAGGTLPVGAPLPCFECHNPHGSSRGNTSMLSDELGASLETSSAAGVRAFCFTCHTTSDTTAGWDSASGSMQPVASGTMVVGLPRDGAELHLSATSGHSEDSTQSCYDCHGDDYAAATGHNVHDPGDGKAAPDPLTVQIVNDRTATTTVDASGTTDTPAPPSTEPSPTLDASATVAPIDLTPPVTVSDAQATYNGTATITLTAIDNTGGSGVAVTYYSLDAGPPTAGTSVSVSATGDHTLSFWSVDAAGNAETPTTATFTITPANATDGLVSLGALRRRWLPPPDA